jgi:hypothetical protein
MVLPRRGPQKKLWRTFMSNDKYRPTIKITCDGNVLRCWRLDRKGSPKGKTVPWQIRTRSYVPRLIFHCLMGYIRKRVNQKEDRNFNSVKEAVLQALCEAAKTCGCKSRFDREGGDVTWYLDDRPFFAFQIHEQEVDKLRAKKMFRGRSKLRWVIEIRDGGKIRYVPRKTNLRASGR